MNNVNAIPEAVQASVKQITGALGMLAPAFWGLAAHYYTTENITGQTLVTRVFGELPRFISPDFVGAVTAQAGTLGLKAAS